MSGESCRVTKPQIHGQSVRPEPVQQKSLYENVTGFINEVVLQSNTSQFEGKERITWVRFDHCDINDLSQFKDRIERNGNSPPFLLIIGYVNGVQAWVIPATGEAVEVFSWRQGAVQTLKVLVSPNTSDSCVDRYSLKRPIVAICDTAGTTQNFKSVSFISLLTGEQLKTIKFNSSVQDIFANKSVVVISFVEKIAVFEATTFDDLFTISSCYKSPGPCVNPIALGDQWLAFADRRIYNIHQSCGGVVTEGVVSYKSTVLHAAKSLTKGLKELGESVATNFMGTPKPNNSQSQIPPNPSTSPGVVTVIDIEKVSAGDVNLANSTCPGIVAHFLAHQGAPIVALEFDSSGMLLATADKLAHTFHVFRIHAHPLCSSQAAVHHLYTLYRGDTTAQVMNMTFSLDSRWLAVATHRGTTHIYPITPYGGNVSWRTHKSVFVVNKLSRFQRSAGLDDSPSSGRNSPVGLSASPVSFKQSFECTPNIAYHNPFYPPYPAPTVIKPSVQLRQPLFQNLLDAIAPGPSPSHSPPCSKSKISIPETLVKVALTFGTSRGWLAGSPTIPREVKKQAVDSLFVMAYHGFLIEYDLQPKVSGNVPADKMTEYSAFDLEVRAYAQWPLARESSSHDVRYPLHQENPLLIPLNAQIPQTIPSPSQPIEQDDPEERWMAQVEINTHTGPNRRLWMGPQFLFKSLASAGNLAGDNENDEHEISDPSLEFPPRSSPVNMPGNRALPVHMEAASLTGSQSPRFNDRLSVESDVSESDKFMAMAKLRHDLADAMQDHPVTKKYSSSGGRESPYLVDDSCFDLSDVMDISCDPPGAFTDIGSGTQDTLRRHHEEQIQAVTAKLHQVAVTSQPDDDMGMSPFRGIRTPSLEECRALTSSAEELSSALEHVRLKDVNSFAWSPIDPPTHSSSPSPAHTSRFIPNPTPIERRSESPPRSTWPIRRAEEIKCVEEDLLKTSWSAVVTEIKPALIPPSPPLLNDSFPPIVSSASASKSATTSEDDLWASKENKKDRKRKRKRNVNNNPAPKEPEDLLGSVASDLPPPIVWQQPKSSSAPMVVKRTQDEQSLSPFDVDHDHFHAMDEYHDPLEPIDTLEVVDDIDRDFRDDPIMLESSHAGDDLAKALEEASSDESLPVKTKKEAVRREADEMFPFRETSSDEEEGALHIRRRNVLATSSRNAIYDDDEDRDTTSGDDRITTSESDVTTSPNPRASAAAKGKKKKKKKK